MTELAVTITITNWNGRHYLGDCLDAVLAQSHSPSQVILIDNASDDDSVAFVAKHYPSVKIVELEANQGPSPARNAGLEAAQTDWVFVIDNDAILSPDCLARLVTELAATEGEPVVLHPRSVFFDEPDRIHYDGASIHFAGIMTLHNYYAPLAEADQTPQDINAAISVALLMHREKTLAAGGFDARHFILYEDHDLSYRIRLRGGTIRHVPGAIVLHKEGTAGISFREAGGYTKKRVQLHSRNRWIVLVKCHSWSSLIFGFPGIVVYELSYLFFALCNGSLLSWLKGKWQFLGMLPALLKERKEIQAHRVLRDREILSAQAFTSSPLIKKGAVTRCIQVSLEGFLTLWWRLVARLT